MTQIVGFAGKKQSGKNTACNFILAMKLAELGICRVSRLSEGGEIEVTDVLGEQRIRYGMDSIQVPPILIPNLCLAMSLGLL